ncbi:uncharacterized protein LOC141899989 [Tubulanus polymorphus]|uniref:uncharacterized protein LOC141899989 n=1 Tax=Tubulanus polymorphus TaxID=672921 RepID=UPI003DA27638
MIRETVVFALCIAGCYAIRGCFKEDNDADRITISSSTPVAIRYEGGRSPCSVIVEAADKSKKLGFTIKQVVTRALFQGDHYFSVVSYNDPTKLYAPLAKYQYTGYDYDEQARHNPQSVNGAPFKTTTDGAYLLLSYESDRNSGYRVFDMDVWQE